MADRFVLARITNMRGVDLRVFDFDFDLTWAGFFMNADQHIYGRFGGRDEHDAEATLTLPSLKYAMQRALDAYRENPNAAPKVHKKPFRSVDQYPAAKRLRSNQCIHCHQVYDFHRDWLRKKGEFGQDDIWVYPPPDNIGIALDVKQGDRLEKVSPNSPADDTGLKSGDQLVTVNGFRVASYGDVQYALNRAFDAKRVGIRWKRNGRTMDGVLELPDGWRKSDISWRGSMWSLEPKAHTYGRDLDEAEKRNLGLSPKRLAFYQGNYVPPVARQAGIRAKDVIIGINDQKLEMTMLQFNVYVRLNFENGDRIVYNVIRNGKRIDIPMTLR